jgi:hypothetical protein
MKTSPRTILAAALALPICVGCVLFGIYPYRPADIRGWLVLVAIAIPILGAYELVGSRLFAPSLGARMSRSARIAYGVVVALIVIALSWFLFNLAQPYLTTWGA